MIDSKDNILKINGEEIELESRIAQIIEKDDIMIVRTEDPDPDEKNIFAFDYEGNRVWEIDVPRWYTSVWELNDQLLTREFDGDEYAIDIETGNTDYLGWGGK